MSPKERQNLIALYKTWSEDELLDALLHREDYLPASITLIQAELAARKALPLAPEAIITHLQDGSSHVKLKLGNVVLPAICPHCLEECSAELIVAYSGPSQREPPKKTSVKVTVPFCAAFVRLVHLHGNILAQSRRRQTPQEFIKIVAADDKTVTFWIANREYAELLAQLNNRTPSTN
jgi:hypothetical protein